MILPKNPLAQTIIQLCKSKNIKHIVISPGSRNAPLTIGFTNHSFFKCYSIVDERSAAFFALGIAQQLREPVVLVCTSGSALLNYYPAIAEAFYSDIPLVILSADRPKHLIGIGDGQTINQNNVFANHILYSANLTQESPEQDETEINLALNTSISQKGPVHLNVSFEEPLYETVDEFSVAIAIGIPNSIEATNSTENLEDLNEYISIWNNAKCKMVLVGVNYPNKIGQQYLEILANDESVIVFTETTSNLHHDIFFPSIDKIIAPLDDEDFKILQPDVLLTFGGMIVSKKVKAFLRKYQPKHHWHIDEKKANDTFFCLEKHFKTSANDFFKVLFKNKNQTNSNYQNYWQSVKQIRSKKHQRYLQNIPFSDLKVFDIILKSIPNHNMLQLGNSSAIRYAQLFDLNNTLKVFCNRGTSGIDGSTSTAIGAALVIDAQTTFITGDLSFFYDSNALWSNYIPNNFRIIVINNEGGGIFRILPGDKDTDNFDTYFETKHQLTAKQLCKMYQFTYFSASNEEDLKTVISSFYSKEKNPKLLEIFTPRTVNDEVLLNYFKSI
ncbi:2-succinyl-5-enolpyruvyl-6-hydroxy-3-cyclohexene-1-carboxylic-acid synthase [Flavobacteriaceae bacterium PRS1]|nr:2-succinyl-5-enolpyruvyl-6-hydroxy-3-cyclohexene-1-carboxylic-acid synthase [Flavobacteriaceae bacterium PRS1]